VEVPAPSAQPYRSPLLWRIHATSALLVVPQFAVATFGLVYLVEERGWLPPAAGAMFAAVGVGGAALRLAVGYWSDRAGSRLRPLRMLTVGIGAVMLALALGTLSGSSATTAVLLVAAVITVSTNGLAFTAVAEHAGRPWAGRALGVQNTAQNAVGAATPPVLAAVIAGAGYGTAFAATVAFPLLACALVPVRAERPLDIRSRVGRHADAPRPARRRKTPAPRPRPGRQRAVVGDDPRRAGRRARGDRG
jgi:MFS family permease